MIAFLTLCYVAILGALVWLKVLPNTVMTWLSTLAWMILLFIVLFIPMQWGAPTGPARIMTYSVQIIPNVAGRVTDVAVEPNKPVKKGALLFKIDPTIYQATVDATRAQLKFQKLRLAQYNELEAKKAGSKFQVEEVEAHVAKLEADLEAAEWNVEETTIEAPSDGYATWVALRPGQRVVTFPLQPAMIFIDTSRLTVGTQIHQIYLRHMKTGQPVEVAFKTVPGRIYKGKIDVIYKVASQGQAVTAGTVPEATPIKAEPFFVKIDMHDKEAIARLPAGSVGTAAIYTNSAGATHIIRKVMLRMESFLNYIIPWL